MSRTLANTAKQAVFDQETSEVFLVLLTISHADLAVPIRVTSDNVDTISNSNTFVSFPFDIRLPSDLEGAPPIATLSVDNVSVEIANSLRSISSPASVQMQVVTADAPDDIIANMPGFILRNIEGDAFKVSGELRLEDISAEPYPGGSFVPSQFNGLYK